MWLDKGGRRVGGAGTRAIVGVVGWSARGALPAWARGRVDEDVLASRLLRSRASERLDVRTRASV